VTLAPSHFKHLRGSGLKDATLEVMACFSVPPAEIDRLSPGLKTCESLLAYPYPGIDGFRRYRLFPPQGSMKYWQPPGSGVHLYILPSVRSILSNPNIEIAITEGEKKAACLTQNGIPAIGIAGVWSWGDGSGGLHPEFDATSFVDRSIMIVFDSNAWRREKEDIGHALYALGKAVENRGGKVEAVIIPPADDGKDQGADDHIVAHGIDNFKKLKRIKLRHDGLAQFKPWWEQWHKGKSKEEKEIDRLAVRLQPVEPWPDPVDGAALLDEIRATFQRFVVTVQPEAVVVESLWILFAHVIEAFGIAPILALWSPVPECGKTVNQSIVGKLVPKALEGSSLTEAVVFRVVEKFQPTLLVDEAADVLIARPELLALLRASHQRNKAFVYRTVGDNHDVTAFSTWAPKSLAITKNKIEDALASRCLIVRMHRKTRSEKTERFSSTKEYPELDVLRRKAARWARDNFAAIRDATAQNVPDIENRSLDNYEPLFKIAHVVGGAWPQLIRDAAIKIIGGESLVDKSMSIELLKDIKTIFEGDPENDADDGCDRIFSANLVDALSAKSDRPWSEYNRGRPITQNQIGRLLKDFGVYSGTVRIGGDTAKGYHAHQFRDAFSRYIPPDRLVTESEPSHGNSANKTNDLDQIFEPSQSDSVTVCKSDLSTEKGNRCDGVTVRDTEKEALAILSPVRYRGANGELHYAGSVQDAWDKITADHESRKKL
jgi:hypothetical protein